MRVSDVMTSATIHDSPDDTLAAAATKMWHQQTGSLLVMEGEKLTGIVTERDVLRVVAEGNDPTSTTLRDAMSTNPVTIPEDTKLSDAATIMFDHWFRHLPVVDDDGRVCGILSLRDLLTLLAEGMQEPETLEPLTGHKLARDVRIQRVEHGDLD